MAKFKKIEPGEPFLNISTSSSDISGILRESILTFITQERNSNFESCLSHPYPLVILTEALTVPAYPPVSITRCQCPPCGGLIRTGDCVAPPP